MNKIRLLFAGSGKFALPTLTSLLDNDLCEVVAVITQPDMPVGRKMVITPTPVKQLILDSRKDVRIYQPEKLKQGYESILAETRPDIIIVAAYGQMIPKPMLDYPKYSSLNIHASLLPKYRGAVPIQASLLNGDNETGVSILKMTPGLDDGPVLAERKLLIAETDNSETLFPKLASLGAELLDEILPKWVAGEVEPVDQLELAKIESRVLSTCSVQDLSRANAEIKSSFRVRQALNRVRAFAQDGNAWVNVSYKGEQLPLKIIKARIAEENIRVAGWGKLVWDDKNLLLNLADGRLDLLEVQLAGRKRASGLQYSYLVEDIDSQSRVVVIAENNLLVIRRNKGGRKYLVLPGGHHKRGETPEIAACRELVEETGIQTSPGDLKYIYSSMSLEGEKIFFYQLNLPRIVPVSLGLEESSRNTADNTHELAWLPIDSAEIARLVFPEIMKHII